MCLSDRDRKTLQRAVKKNEKSTAVKLIAKVDFMLLNPVINKTYEGSHKQDFYGFREI